MRHRAARADSMSHGHVSTRFNDRSPCTGTLGAEPVARPMERHLVPTVALALLCVLSGTATAAMPTVAEAAAKAKEKGPLTLLAAAEVKVAGSQKHAAGLPSLTNPYIELFVDRSKDTSAGVAVHGSLWLPIELAGQRDKRIGEVDTLIAWKQGARAAAEAVAVGEAVTAWGELVVALSRRAEAHAGEKIAREEAAYVKGRLEAKDATAVDAAVAEGEVARWVQAKVEADIAVATTKTRLAIAVGEATLDTAEDAPKIVLPELRWKDDGAFVKHVEEHSPVLLAAEREATYFLASRDRWDTEKYPPVNLILSAGRTDSGAFQYGVGLAWSLPVLRKNQAEVGRADAEAERAKAAKIIARTALVARAKGAFAAYTAARTALSTVDEIAMPAATAVVDASVAAWKAGKLEASRVFLARRDLATARARRLDVVAIGYKAFGDLAGLLGEVPS